MALSFSLEIRVELNSLLIDSNHDVVASADNTVVFQELPVRNGRKFGKKSLILLLRRYDINLVIGSEERSELVLSVLGKSWIWLKFRVSVIGVIVAGNCFASGAESDLSDEGISNSGFLDAIFLVGEL